MPQLAQSPFERYESESASAGLPWRLFSISATILFIAVLTYFGLTFGYNKILQDRLDSQNQELTALAARISKSQSDQDSFIGFYSQLVNLKTIFNNHVVSSRLFSVLESLTHQRVYFSGVDLKLVERQLDLDGVAESFGVLSEQLESLRQRPEVERTLLSQSQRGEDGIRFKLTLILKKDIFEP